MMADSVVFGLMILAACLALAGLWLFFARYRLQQAERHRWLALIAGNGLVLLALLAILLPVGEAYFRWFYDGTDAFGLTKTTSQWFDRHFQTNAQGFRDTVASYSLKRLPDKKRLIVLGDSFTAGHGIAEIDDRFVNRIQRDLPGWEVQSHAVCGWDTPHELNHLRVLESQLYEADAVLLIYCLNDLAPLVPEWQSISRELLAHQQPGFFIEHSFLLNILYYRLFSVAHPQVAHYYTFLVDAYQGSPWLQQQAELKRLQVIVEDRLHAKLLVATLPFFNDLGPNYAFRQAHAELAEFWTTQGVSYLDLLPKFENQNSASLVVNRFDPHPNERAHALIAEELERFVRKNLAN